MKDLAYHSVIVGDGSGCLFKVNSTEYVYVLTAKHVVQDVQDIKVIHQYIDNSGHLIKQELNTIGNAFFHNDPNKDAAIIKVEFIDNLKYINRHEYININNDTYELIGHPDTRKGENYSYRANSLTLKNVKEFGYIEAELEKSCTHSEIVGQSGGGIMKVDGNDLLLIGIQKKMSVPDDVELLSRIDFMPLSFFDEIVNQNSNKLKEIIPAYLECFSSLKNQVTPLVGCFLDNHISFTRNYLRSVTDKIVGNNLTPKFIKEFFKKRLLIYNQHENVLNNKGLWLAWLEFLIIMNIYKDGSVNAENIEEIFNSHRLIFSSTENDWSMELENIVKSDFKGLQIDSKIIVSTDKPPILNIIPKGWVPDIIRNQNIPRAELMIDEATKYPLADFKLIHLAAFQKDCIVSKPLDYKDYNALNEDELLAKLKEEYESLFS